MNLNSPGTAARWSMLSADKCLCSALLFALLAGCNSGLKTYPVDGKVVWKQGGAAASELAGYRVMFETEDQLTSGAGTILADGTFTIGTMDEADGATAGPHRVAFAQPDGPMDAPPKPWLVAKKFGRFETSGLTTEIKPGHNSVVLEVER